MSYADVLADLVTALGMLKKLLWLVKKSKTAQKWMDSHVPDFQATVKRLIDKYPNIKEPT